MVKKIIAVVSCLVVALSCVFGLCACGTQESSLDAPLANPRTQKYYSRKSLSFQKGTVFNFNYLSSDSELTDDCSFMLCGETQSYGLEYTLATAVKGIDKKEFIFAEMNARNGGWQIDYPSHVDSLFQFYNLSGKFGKDTIFVKDNFKKARTDTLTTYYAMDTYAYFFNDDYVFKGDEICTVKGEFYDVYYNDVKVFTFGIHDGTLFDDESIEVLYTRLITGATLRT